MQHPWTDTHCHIHEADYPDAPGAYDRALAAGVDRLICVGTDVASSRQAVAFAQGHVAAWAAIGLHPHDAANDGDAPTSRDSLTELESLLIDSRSNKKDHVDKIVAIGECGLDYFYDNAPRDQQIAVLEAQLQLATRYDLPVIFHVRDSKTPQVGSVWDDFWPIFDQFPQLRGVLHSFTDTQLNLEAGLSRGLYVGVNGISTFTKYDTQRAMFAAIPLTHLLFETDAPYLTPIPLRGHPNEPANIVVIARHQAALSGQPFAELSTITQANAGRLFKL